MGAIKWKPLYKAGDKLRVIDEIWGHGFEIGDEVTIDQVHREDECYRCVAGNGDWWLLTEDEVELISKN